MNTEHQIKTLKHDILSLQDSIIENKNHLKSEIEYLKKDILLGFWIIQILLGVALILAGTSFFIK